jgi:hypothetical protein
MPDDRRGELRVEDDGDVSDTDEWDLGDAVEQILEVAALPPEAAPALVECLAAVGGSYPDGWLVLWWMPIDLDVEGIVFTGNTLPAAAGWNCIYVADRDSLLAVVIDAADQGSSCVVVDIAESF